MKNSTLLIRSILIVAVLAAVPHGLALYSGTTDSTEMMLSDENDDSSQGQVQPDETNSNLDEWRAYWPAKYNVSFADIEEKAVYEIREENGQLNCYSIFLIDAQGNQFSDNTLVMEGLTTDQNVANGKYNIEYDGEKYSVESQLIMDEEGNIKLSYEYYGYEGKETWTRIE